MTDEDMCEDITLEYEDKISKLEEENKQLRAVLEDGSSGLGLSPAECQEVLNRFPKKED